MYASVFFSLLIETTHQMPYQLLIHALDCVDDDFYGAVFFDREDCEGCESYDYDCCDSYDCFDYFLMDVAMMLVKQERMLLIFFYF